MKYHVAVAKHVLSPQCSLVRLIPWSLGLTVLFAGGLRASASEILRLNIAPTNSNVVITWTNAGAALESARTHRPVE